MVQGHFSRASERGLGAQIRADAGLGKALEKEGCERGESGAGGEWGHGPQAEIQGWLQSRQVGKLSRAPLHLGNTYLSSTAEPLLDHTCHCSPWPWLRN